MWENISFFLFRIDLGIIVLIVEQIQLNEIINPNKSKNIHKGSAKV